jgi:hypothetical protein
MVAAPPSAEDRPIDRNRAVGDPKGVTMSSKSRRTLAGLAAAVLIAAPAASARPIDDPALSPRTAQVPPPPSSIAQSVGMEYGELRAQHADTRAVESSPVAEAASATGGFDWASAGIGAAVAGALALVSWTALGPRRTARA